MIYRTIFFFFIIIPTLVKGQVAVGLFGSLDNSKFSGDTPREYGYAFKNGFAVGLTFDKSLEARTFISVRPNYTRGGADLVNNYDDVKRSTKGASIDTVFFFPITNKYLALPVLSQIYVARGFYANAGLELLYQINSTVQVFDQVSDITDRINRWNYNAVFGFGFSIPAGRTSFNIEGTYTQGLNTVTKKSEIIEEISPRLRTSRFRVSVYFIVFTSKEIM